MKSKIVAGNWKMNCSRDEANVLTSEIVNMLQDEVTGDVKVVLAPPFVHLSSVVHLVKNNKRIGVAAQNCSSYGQGAYTGEVSASMIRSVGGEYVIIGHSERRSFFKETNDVLADKIKLALQNDLIPVFCCGEILEERNTDRHFEIVQKQLEESVFILQEADFRKIVIAYEPVWAIGTGLTATPTQAQEMHEFTRQLIANKYSPALSDSISILYGGSCNDQNAKELFAQKDIDGGLIGGASLKSRSFVNIVKSF